MSLSGSAVFRCNMEPNAQERTSVVTEPREPEAPSADVPPETPEPNPWRPVEPPQQPPVEPAEPPEEPPVASFEPPEQPLVERVEPVGAREQPSAEPDQTPGEPEHGQAEEPTTVLQDEGEPTTPVFAPAATQRLALPEPVPPPLVPAEAIFRQPSPTTVPNPEQTRVEPPSQEEERLAAERAARRDARTAAFAAPVVEPMVAPEPVVVLKRTNDGFWGSLGLFLVRVVLAGVIAVRGLFILTDIPAAEAQFATTILADYPPGAQLWAIITGVSSLLVALSLLLGLLTRVAGLGVALITGGALTFLYWGPWSPFLPGQPGFLGEYELVLAAVGLLLLFIGGGGWSLDRSFRAGRERNRLERTAEDE